MSLSLIRSLGGVCCLPAMLAAAGVVYAGVPQPVIPNQNFNVLNYGAVGDGVTTNTAALQNTINAAHAAGGGVVEIPSGTYLSGPITLASSINLRLDAGALLRMLPFGQYPVTWHTNGNTAYFVASGNFISGQNLSNVEISGAGAMDGQGAPWWPWAYTNGAVRPIMIQLNGCSPEMITGVTLSNSPMFHIAIGSGNDTTVQFVTEQAPASEAPVNPSHNTDACDVSGFNTLVESNHVSVGDDDFTCGGGTADVAISNNVYGNGHGVSIGSYTSPSVSNFVVMNCTFTNTDTGVRIKTDRDRGGFVHEIQYSGLSMTNVMRPILIYCEYTNKTIPSLDSITPAVAAAYPAATITATTPHYRDITLSNITGNAQSGRTAGLVWGLPESAVSNLTLVNVHLQGSKTFGIYDAHQVLIADGSVSVPAGNSEYSFFDSQVTFSNSAPPSGIITLDGATRPGYPNQWSFYQCNAALADTNALALDSAVTLNASLLVISNNLVMSPSNRFDYVLGSAAASVEVRGNLTLDGTNDIIAGPGFTNGVYTLMTYSGQLKGGLPSLGVVPSGFACQMDTNISGEVLLVVGTSTPVPTPGEVINVNMQHGASYTGTAAAPDSGTVWNSVTGGGTVGNLMNSLGQTLTNVSVTLTSSSGSYNFYNDNSSGNPDPLALMSGYIFGATYTVVISNLAPNQPFGLYAYSHGNVDNQTGTITLAPANGGASASTQATGNTADFRDIYLYGQGYDYVALDGLSDGNGNFAFTVVNYLNGFQLVKLTSPQIAGLTNETVEAGGTVTLSPVISGVPAPGFQWFDNGVAMAGQTNGNLTLNNVAYSQNGTVYSLLASNVVGLASNGMTLTVIVPPAISGLYDQSAAVGSTVTMSTAVTGEPAPVSYWQFNGHDLTDGATGHGSTISGSGTSTLVLANAQTGDSGTYTEVAGNMAGSVTNSMTLTVSSGNVAPAVTGPTDQTVVAGSNATFAASVSGLPVPSLQWRQNGINLAGAAQSTLTVSNVSYSQNGYVYSLVATNVAGMVTNSATLNVLVPVSITTSPTNLVVTNSQAAVFSVVASGVPSPHYQWYFDGSPIAGAASAQYILPNASPTNMGSFLVVVSNQVNTVTSSVAMLTVDSTMTIVGLVPENGSVAISPDTPLTLVFNAQPVLKTPGSGKILIYNAANPSVPVDTLDMSQNATLESPFAVNIQPRVIAGDTFNSFPVMIHGNDAVVYPHLDLLTSNQTYFVTVDGTVFTDTNGAYFAGISGSNGWRFSARTRGPLNATNLVVAQDGTGDFATVQGAIDFVPPNNTAPTLIQIRNGIYTEIVEAHGKNNLLLRGQSRAGTVIAYPNNGNVNPNTHLEIVFKDNANDISLDNLTLDDTSGYGASPAEALMIESGARRFIGDNVTIESYQDTMLANQSSSQGYFKDCLVQGSVDFIWGGGNLFFTNSEILWLTQGGEGPNPSPSSSDINSNGFSFVNCTLATSNGITGALVGRTRGITNGNTALIQCLVSPAIGGWSSDALPVGDYRNWYYDCSNLSATAAITLSNAIPLTGTDPDTLAAGNASVWLYGWNPALSPNIIGQPISQSVGAGGQISLSVQATGVPDPQYQWMLDGTNLPNANQPILTVDNAHAGQAGTYSVSVVNSSGEVISSNAQVSVANTAPVLPDSPNVILNAGTVLEATNAAVDPDAPPQVLTYSLQQGPAGASVDPQTGLFTWRPAATQAGSTNIINIVVTDDGTPPLSATNQFQAVVRPVVLPSMKATLTGGGLISILVGGGTLGPDYVVQTSTNLVNWQTLLVSNAPAQPFTFTWPVTGGGPDSFYRVKLSP